MNNKKYSETKEGKKLYEKKGIFVNVKEKIDLAFEAGIKKKSEEMAGFFSTGQIFSDIQVEQIKKKSFEAGQKSKETMHPKQIIDSFYNILVTRRHLGIRDHEIFRRALFENMPADFQSRSLPILNERQRLKQEIKKIYNA